MHVLESLERSARSLAQDLEQLPADLKQFMMVEGLQHPAASPPLFQLLRKYWPILVLGPVAVVSKYADVREVLDNDADFTVDLYGPKMAGLAGLSTLAMGNTPEYRHDSAALAAAVRPEDLPAIKEWAAGAASAYVDYCKPARQVDAVVMVRSALNRVTEQYFGTPGLGQATQYYWVQTLYDEIFANLERYPIRTPSVAAATAWMAYMLNLIAQRKTALAAGENGPDDLVQRLVRAQTGGNNSVSGESDHSDGSDGSDGSDDLDESGNSGESHNWVSSQPHASISDGKIAANLIYMMVGFVPNVLRLAILALDELLDRPEALAGAQQAAQENNDRLLQAHLFEALRFNPPTPGLLRRTPPDRAVTLAAGTARATTIPGGCTVFVALQSAMQDADELSNPEAFRIDRPPKHYLYFGRGLHTCLGRHVGAAVVTTALKPLLQQRGLRRSPGPEGLVSWDGAFPRSLNVSFQ